MKKALSIAVLLVAASAAFSSCKKMYSCECTDPTGGVTYHNINATNRVEAASNCSDISRVKKCELK